MIELPVLQSLTVENYGLYPPSLERPFMTNFMPGGTAVIGVNGSGKTTFINICFRCLTGPYNLPAATSSTELGQIRARHIPMQPNDAGIFASRVADGAKDATATLQFELRGVVVKTKRRLRDLSLVYMQISEQSKGNGKTKEILDEEAYQQHLCDLVGVDQFFDVLIILQFLMFLKEDRRALVWDPTAQRQIFRVLLLPAEKATEYAEAQREVISADSAVRNTQSLITRYEREQHAAARRVKAIADAEAERRLLIKEATAIAEKLENIAQQRVKADQDRHRARLDRLKAVQTRENLIRALEQIKMKALGQSLDASQETLKYILGHLLAEKRCIVCGTDPSPVAEQIEDWLRAGCCPICGSKHEIGQGVVHISSAIAQRIQRIEEELSLVEQQIAHADEQISSAQGRYSQAEIAFQELDRSRVRLDVKIMAVLRRLPAERAAVGSAESQVDTLRKILSNEKGKRTRAEKRFGLIVAELVSKAQKRQKSIATAFKKYVQIFLKEDAVLLYQTVSDRLGQGGSFFEFPAFRLSMSGGAIAGQTVRDSPSHVSQSQAEFVDLAFRMALMSADDSKHASTLVVDAPEASLDFLFAERAGEQLANFSTANSANRVILTSYLPSDHLLKAFFRSTISPHERRSRIVNLIEDAAPNAATRADKKKYDAFLDGIIKGADG